MFDRCLFSLVTTGNGEVRRVLRPSLGDVHRRIGAGLTRRDRPHRETETVHGLLSRCGESAALVSEVFAAEAEDAALVSEAFAAEADAEASEALCAAA